jgi:predicted RNA methylase
MAKLTKEQARHHAEACKLLAKEKLSLDEKYFVLENWREDAQHINSVNGAFFTPPALARDLSIEVNGPRVVDLCAGIGSLAFAVWQKHALDRASLNQVTCVEINPDYVAVGKKILPEARWVQADVFDLPSDIGHFDCVIANPPFGATRASGEAPRFTPQIFEYRVIDIASDLADYGVFIIPQTSAPFEYSGKQAYRWNEHDKYRNFHKQTSIVLGPNCGLDTSVHRADWTAVPPAIEIVTANLLEARNARLSAVESSRVESRHTGQAGSGTLEIQMPIIDQLDLF